MLMGAFPREQFLDLVLETLAGAAVQPVEVISPLLVGGCPHGRRRVQRLRDRLTEAVGRIHVHERALQEVAVVLAEQWLAVAMHQAWKVVDDAGLAEGQEVEDRAGGDRKSTRLNSSHVE